MHAALVLVAGEAHGEQPILTRLTMSRSTVLRRVVHQKLSGMILCLMKGYMDEKQRSLERQALDDPAALEQLRRSRCRSGECCAHYLGPEGYHGNVIVEETHYDMRSYSGSVEAGMQLRIIGTYDEVMIITAWLNNLFEVMDRETGIMNIKTIGERLDDTIR